MNGTDTVNNTACKCLLLCCRMLLEWFSHADYLYFNWPGVIHLQNVHMLIRKKSDIEKYTGERYKVATTVALTVLEFLESLEKPQVIR